MKESLLIYRLRVFFDLKRLGRTIRGMTILVSLVLNFLLRNPIESLLLLGAEMYGVVERTLKPAAKSERAKRFILDERAFFQQLVEQSDAG